MTPSSKASTRPWQASPSSLTKRKKKAAPERRVSGAEFLYGVECRYLPASTRSWGAGISTFRFGGFWVTRLLRRTLAYHHQRGEGFRTGEPLLPSAAV